MIPPQQNCFKLFWVVGWVVAIGENKPEHISSNTGVASGFGDLIEKLVWLAWCFYLKLISAGP